MCSHARCFLFGGGSALSAGQWVREAGVAPVLVTASATFSASIFVIMAFVARATNPLTGNALLLLKGVWLVSLLVPFLGMGAIYSRSTLLLLSSVCALFLVLGCTFAVVFIWV